ncbi:PREDICTED: uncharacterized protein LOC109363560 [Lupinus angustifolius]|uniref:uncharacterized protein LOC109363560 n=1 Tax=Lupinus angustifolius TaxID=3871 RepID=UPI00092EE183|nr:PREDICTED: uncharacterized protein LOC109363560 [Lupinus angustifolius]
MFYYEYEFAYKDNEHGFDEYMMKDDIKFIHHILYEDIKHIPTGAFIHTMAKNTRLKDLQTQIHRLTETMEKRDADYAVRASLAEAHHNNCIDRIEVAIESLAEKFSSSPTPFRGVPNSFKQPFQVRNVKLDFPRFDGKHPLEWIFKSEQFFDYYDTPDSDRLIIAPVHLDDATMMQWSNPFHSWQAFTRALELDFCPSVFDCPRATLFKLLQTGSISDYYRDFTALANRTLSTGMLWPKSPINLLKVVALAKLFEEKYQTTPTKYPYSTNNHKAIPNSSSYQTRFPGPKPSLPPLLPTPNIRPHDLTQKPTNIKRITPVEMQVRRDKGLCYYCDEKFSFSHKCPNKHLLLLQVDDISPNDPHTDPPDIPQSPDDPSRMELHLSLNTMTGANGVGTIKFTGLIGELQILLDGGISDNFLQIRLAHFLNLPVEPAPCFKLLVGNGNTLSAEAMINNLAVKVQGHELCLPVYMLPVVGADLILGAAWLATLGPHVADYASLSLKVFHNGTFITLHRDKHVLPVVSQFHHIRRLHHTRSISEMFAIQMTASDTPPNQLQLPEDIAPELVALLHQYRLVFSIPIGLPPSRQQNHAINLKDGTWRFCTDYQALNAITVKDSFPMPTVDELLDELFGARYFSKLDLHSGFHQIRRLLQDSISDSSWPL